MQLRIKQLSTLVATLLVITVNVSAEDSRSATLVVDEMVVNLIDQNEIPAGETGMIAELSVREGDSVQAGQSLGKLDDRRVLIEAAAAETQSKIAQQRLQGNRGGAIAKKKLDQARQMADEHGLAIDIANRKAENEVRILASQKSEAVAKNELDRANVARKRFIDSVSRSEIDGLRLAFERTQLELEQARFEHQIDKLQAEAEQAAANGHQIDIERSAIEVEQAEAERLVQTLELSLTRQRHSLAMLAAERHKFVAPFDGVVAEVMANQGDWVKSGDPVLRIIRLDRLSAEGFISADKIRLLRDRSDVNLEIETVDASLNQTTIQRPGEVVFISPEIDPVSNEVKFRVEFDNPQRDVLPGMRLRMSVGS